MNSVTNRRTQRIRLWRMGWLAAAVCIGLLAQPAFAADPTVNAIVDGIEKRYADGGFTARFVQTSAIAAMNIIDTATGSITVKRPDKMRWEYDTPEKQTIVTDGQQLWIYRPLDRQVSIGSAPNLFGGGKGASFLADVSVLRKQFSIVRQADTPDGQYRLQLTPNTPVADLKQIFLEIDPTRFDIMAVVTINAYDDETRIDIRQTAIKPNLPDTVFQFNIPKGTDVITMD